MSTVETQAILSVREANASPVVEGAKSAGKGTHKRGSRGKGRHRSSAAPSSPSTEAKTPPPAPPIIEDALATEAAGKDAVEPNAAAETEEAVLLSMATRADETEIKQVTAVKHVKSTVIICRGGDSIEKLRALRNRTTFLVDRPAAAALHSEDGGLQCTEGAQEKTKKIGSKTSGGVDEEEQRAIIDEISKLLLRYCMGSDTARTQSSAVSSAPTGSAHAVSAESTPSAGGTASASTTSNAPAAEAATSSFPSSSSAGDAAAAPAAAPPDLGDGKVWPTLQEAARSGARQGKHGKEGKGKKKGAEVAPLVTAALHDQTQPSTNSSPPVAAVEETDSQELELYSHLIRLYQKHKLTVSMLELVHEMLMHTRVIPLSVMKNSATVDPSSPSASATQRRAYLQRVIMTLLTEMKTQKSLEEAQARGEPVPVPSAVPLAFHGNVVEAMRPSEKEELRVEKSAPLHESVRASQSNHIASAPSNPVVSASTPTTTSIKPPASIAPAPNASPAAAIVEDVVVDVPPVSVQEISVPTATSNTSPPAETTTAAAAAAAPISGAGAANSTDPIAHVTAQPFYPSFVPHAMDTCFGLVDGTAGMNHSNSMNADTMLHHTTFPYLNAGYGSFGSAPSSFIPPNSSLMDARFLGIPTDFPFAAVSSAAAAAAAPMMPSHPSSSSSFSHCFYPGMPPWPHALPMFGMNSGGVHEHSAMLGNGGVEDSHSYLPHHPQHPTYPTMMLSPTGMMHGVGCGTGAGAHPSVNLSHNASAMDVAHSFMSFDPSAARCAGGVIPAGANHVMHSNFSIDHHYGLHSYNYHKNSNNNSNNNNPTMSLNHNTSVTVFPRQSIPTSVQPHILRNFGPVVSEPASTSDQQQQQESSQKAQPYASLPSSRQIISAPPTLTTHTRSNSRSSTAAAAVVAPSRKKVAPQHSRHVIDRGARCNHQVHGINFHNNLYGLCLRSTRSRRGRRRRRPQGQRGSVVDDGAYSGARGGIVAKQRHRLRCTSLFFLLVGYARCARGEAHGGFYSSRYCW